MPSYVIDENPQYATWEGFQDDADVFSTADTGDKGRFLGADTTYSIFDEQIIAALDLDLEVIYSGSEDASLSALDTAVQNQDPILMYWWTPQWANTRVRPRGGRAACVRRQCADIALNDPEAVGYDCDYADDVLYKAFSAQLEEKDRQHSSSCRTSMDRRRTRTASRSRSRKERSPRRPRRNGSTRTRTSGKPGCRRPDRAFEDDAGAASGRPAVGSES